MNSCSGRRKPVHPLVALARKSIESFLKDGAKPSLPTAPEMSEPAATFVSLKKFGRLRGCIGTLMPVTNSLGEEVIENAISAAVRDPRFSPVTVEELDDIDISVDVLFPPEPIESENQLDPKRFGVIVKSGGRTGVLLPDLAGIETAREQVDIARRKAGIAQTDDVELFRFEVKRFY